MSYQIPDPAAWQARTPGLGSCFHQALTRWALHQRENWRVGVGVLSHPDGHRNVHAWLERDAEIMSAVNACRYERDFFYLICNIEPDSVRLVNPRRILRAHRDIDGETVTALLAAWGGRYHVNEQGGIIAD